MQYSLGFTTTTWAATWPVNSVIKEEQVELLENRSVGTQTTEMIGKYLNISFLFSNMSVFIKHKQ